MALQFRINPLTAKAANFFDDAQPAPRVVDGAGQMVYWKDCFVKVYRATDTSRPLERRRICDGEGLVPRGITVWFGGQGGRVKEV